MAILSSQIYIKQKLINRVKGRIDYYIPLTAKAVKAVLSFLFQNKICCDKIFIKTRLKQN